MFLLLYGYALNESVLNGLLRYFSQRIVSQNGSRDSLNFLIIFF